MVAMQFLERDGFSEKSITIVNNGQEVLSALAKQHYDLVLMDVQMPVMDGIDATRRIRADEQREGRQGTPIIAMTAHSMSGDRERFLAAGMSDYISKPVEASLLHAVLMRWLPANTFSSRDEASESIDKQTDEFDWSRLAAISGGDTEIEQRLLQEFLNTAPRMLLRCRFAVEMEDGPVLEHWAHTLKGSCGTLGATAVATLCQQLEILGREERTKGAVDILSLTEEAFARTEQQVHCRLATCVMGA